MTHLLHLPESYFTGTVLKLATLFLRFARRVGLDWRQLILCILLFAHCFPLCPLVSFSQMLISCSLSFLLFVFIWKVWTFLCIHIFSLLSLDPSTRHSFIHSPHAPLIFPSIVPVCSGLFSLFFCSLYLLFCSFCLLSETCHRQRSGYWITPWANTTTPSQSVSVVYPLYACTCVHLCTLSWL